MATENVEDFYNNLIAAIRDSLTAVSGLAWSPPQPIDQAKLKELLPEGGWFSYNTTWQPLVEALPPYQPWYAGFHLVDVARFGHCALIAFRWRETGDEIFVHTVDLRLFTDTPTVNWAEAIITCNLLERMGGGWYKHHTLRRIYGLTYIEWNL